MNKLGMAKRAEVVRCLVEGASIRSASRMTGIAKATILKLLVELGEFCSVYQDYVLRNLKTTRVEADEIWAFVGAKQKNARQEGHGDIWTFTALDADSKLMITWLVGGRYPQYAKQFMLDLASRLANRVQLTTDGLHMYRTAVEAAFGADVDYAQLVKSYGVPSDDGVARRYSPMVCTGAEKQHVNGDPIPELVSTSYVERANLTMRMGMRRFTRLTNGYSKKAENHAHAVSLYFMFYNFCRTHATLTKKHPKHYPTTPAMAAGITDHVWSIEEILSLMNPLKVLG